jgi:hypothetical protein
MNKKILLIFLTGTLLYACTNRSSGGSSSGDRIEITPFIVSKVILQDTLVLNRLFLKDTGYKGTFVDPGISYDNNPALYLEKKEFENLQSSVWTMMRDPKSKIFLGLNGTAPDWSKPASKKELRDRFFRCDTVPMSTYDPNGNEIITAVWACDSTSIIDGLGAIYFYETWYFNKANNMIEKEVLGYSLFQYIEEKQAFRQLFFVFRDEEALKKAKENYSDL